MGCADFGVVSFTGVQIVVELLDASIIESLRLLFGEQTKATADRNINLLFNAAYSLGQEINLTLIRSARTDYNTVATTPSLLSFLCSFQEFLHTHKGVAFNVCSRDTRLRTVVAILRANSAFCIDKHMQLD